MHAALVSFQHPHCVLRIWYTGYPLFIFYFLHNAEVLQIISLFWPLRSFIIDFLHQLFLMATLDQWVQPSSFKESQGLFVVLTNYWSNHLFIPLLVLERLFCVQWIYLHCVSSSGTKYTSEWYPRLHAVFEI